LITSQAATSSASIEVFKETHDDKTPAKKTEEDGGNDNILNIAVPGAGTPTEDQQESP